MIGLGTGISDIREFNRRAAKSLRQISFTEGSWDHGFAENMILHIERGGTPTEQQQKQLYRIITRYSRQISDKLVVDYATVRTKGY